MFVRVSRVLAAGLGLAGSSGVFDLRWSTYSRHLKSSVHLLHCSSSAAWCELLVLMERPFTNIHTAIVLWCLGCVETESSVDLISHHHTETKSDMMKHFGSYQRCMWNSHFANVQDGFTGTSDMSEIQEKCALHHPFKGGRLYIILWI